MPEDHCQEDEATSIGRTQPIELSVSNGEIPHSLADGEVQPSSNVTNTAKDPRIIARKYQLELCKKAVEENVIVYLGTGCGKTHIAVLLIYELGHLIKKPQKNICVFLAPTIPLVRQQARVIEESTDFKVGSYYGSSKCLKRHADWEKEIEQYEVLVMTPQILKRNLHHCFIRMEQIALLIFDECHHAQARSSHPYAQIMKEFYETGALRRPRIFGMTASPIVGKGASNQVELPICINSLEKLLDAKVCSVSNKEELESFVASPKVKVYCYGPVLNASLSYDTSFVKKLEEIKGQCMSTLSMKADDRSRLQNNKRSLGKLHSNLIFCLQNLGLWGIKQAIRILFDGDNSERNELMGTEAGSSENSLADQYLANAASVLDSDLMKGGIGTELSALEALKEPFFSKKLLTLIEILSNFRLQPNMKCIVFVNRIIVARSLSCILQKLKCLAIWKCDFLVGFHSGLKNMSRKIMNSIVEKFRSGELNLLVATNVGEEGLDIQTCCLVIRFDLPATVASFIQSRGRARMPQSEYAFLVDRGDPKELNLINGFRFDEDRMNEEIICRTSRETFEELDDAIYKVGSTGASTSANYSVSLLYHYCSQLPHDEYFNPTPELFYFDDVEGILCHIIFPSNAPIHKVVSAPQPSKELAKKSACLKACQELHKLGALTDYLLPGQVDEVEGLVLPSSNSETIEDLRGELHEMLIPAVLKVPWNNSEVIILNFYFIKFAPSPEDRLYQKFGIFVKAPLPREAERMELDLHLDHGRIVRTELVPLGLIEFEKDEILLAENFQEMFLKIILDRDDFLSDSVPLGKTEKSQLRLSTFYLLLPVREHECEDAMTVDWKIVRRCLSSPVFKIPTGAVENGVLPVNQSLKLASGSAGITDIVKSLVFVPQKKSFFFIDSILPEINGYSQFKGYSSYKEYFLERFGIHLSYPEQPFLKAKQLFVLHNLLRNRKQENIVVHEKKEHFVELPPELCQLKIIGFSKDMGSSVSLLPSIMHRLENLLVAIELKDMLSDSFPEGSEVTASRVLEALTTEKCSERFSLERLEVLGDAFLKYAVGRHLFLLYEALDEGELTRRRSNIVNNSHLYKLASRSNLQVYIRDQPFEPCKFFTFGRLCPIICDKDTETTIHCRQKSGTVAADGADVSDVRCNRCHHWLYKKTIADVVEALIGAFLVDSGFKAAIAFLRWIGIEVDFDDSQVSKICMASQGYMSLSDSVDIGTLENSLGYQFLHKGLLVQAFVHPSYNHPLAGCYQRLEFLGDAVLDYLITSYLYSVYPKLKPGELTDLRSVSVNNNSFARIAVFRSFHTYLISDSDSLSEAITKFVTFVQTPGSEKCLNEGPKCPKVLGDLVESCVGAVLLDSGFDLNHVWRLMLSFVAPIMSFSSLQFNPIRELQELCQYHNWALQFPPSSKMGGAFVVEVCITGKDIDLRGSARDPNSKVAKRMAAQQIFLKLKEQGYGRKNKTEKFLEANRNKQEAKLIGYDESPINMVVPECINLKALKLQDASPAKGNHSKNREDISEGSKTKENSGSKKNSQSPGIATGSSKSFLYEICATNYWKAPTFECCKEEGPSHLKLFTFKVTVEIEEASKTVVECFGLPQPGKKAAAEHAADGALWYLKHQGYLPEDNTKTSLS